MDKMLIYHLYIGEDIDDNISYKIHKECLKYYKDIFSQVKFVMVLDDLNNKELKLKGLDFINNLDFTCETTIVIRENTYMYEADTLKKELLDANNPNGSYCFFAHNKGLTNFRNIQRFTYDEESILTWILVMYFYNFNYIKEVESILIGKLGLAEVMYGTLLLENNDPNTPLCVSKYHFSGTFYWFNNQFYKNLVKSNRLEEFVPATRMDCEMMPGYLFDRSIYGGGIRTHNDAAFNYTDFLNVFYRMNQNDWNYVLDVLGDRELFNNFKEIIKEKIEW